MNEFSTKYGQWAVVVGVSEGLGEAFAHRLASRGLNLLLVARRETELRAVADTIRRTYTVEVRPVVADLADPKIENLILNVTRNLEVGTLVYNAAHVPAGRFVDVELDSLKQAVDVIARGSCSTSSLSPSGDV